MEQKNVFHRDLNEARNQAKISKSRKVSKFEGNNQNSDLCLNMKDQELDNYPAYGEEEFKAVAEDQNLLTPTGTEVWGIY